MGYNVGKWNPQRRMFFELWKETGFDWSRRSECMKKAGYADSTIKSSAARKAIIKPIRDIILDTMEVKGLTVTKIVETHRDQLDAMSAANPKMPDNGARIKAVDMAYKIMGAYPDPKIQIESRSIKVNIDMETLAAAQEASGENIIDMIPAALLVEGREEPENLLREHEQEPSEALDSV
jgi:hypothetical protein